MGQVAMLPNRSEPEPTVRAACERRVAMTAAATISAPPAIVRAPGHLVAATASASTMPYTGSSAAITLAVCAVTTASAAMNSVCASAVHTSPSTSSSTMSRAPIDAERPPRRQRERQQRERGEPVLPERDVGRRPVRRPAPVHHGEQRERESGHDSPREAPHDGVRERELGHEQHEARRDQQRRDAFAPAQRRPKKTRSSTSVKSGKLA